MLRRIEMAGDPVLLPLSKSTQELPPEQASAPVEVAALPSCCPVSCPWLWCGDAVPCVQLALPPHLKVPSEDGERIVPAPAALPCTEQPVDHSLPPPPVDNRRTRCGVFSPLYLQHQACPFLVLCLFGMSCATLPGLWYRLFVHLRRGLPFLGQDVRETALTSTEILALQACKCITLSIDLRIAAWPYDLRCVLPSANVAALTP